MTDHTTQGTAGLIERLADFSSQLASHAKRSGIDAGPAWCESQRALIDLAVAAISAKPAPVEAEPYAWLFEPHPIRLFFEKPKDPRGWIALYTSPPAPELAVADEGRFEELLDDYAMARDRFLRGTGTLDDSAKARIAVLQAFKQSRPPVQEGAQCSCASGETTGWTEDNLMVPRCNICGLPVMRIIEERKAERSAPSQAIPEGYDQAEIDGMHALIEKQAALLTGVVHAIRGEPPELTLWSHHDAPELVARVVESAKRQLEEFEKLSRQCVDLMHECNEKQQEINRLRTLEPLRGE